MPSSNSDPLPKKSQYMLGWKLVQEALANQAFSPATQVQCRNLRPTEDYSKAKQALQETEEMVAIAESGESLPLYEFEDLEPVLKEVSTHRILEPKQGLFILQSIRLGQAIRIFFQDHKTSAHLTNLSTRIDPLSTLCEKFNHCISDDGEIREDATPELKQAIRAVHLAQTDLEKELGKLMLNTPVKESLQDFYFTEREGQLVLHIKPE